MIIFPILWLLIASFKPAFDIISGPKASLGSLNFTLENYYFVFSSKFHPVFVYMANSLIFACVTAFACSVLATLSGYALARYKFSGSTLFVILILSLHVFPETLLVIPLFRLIKSYGLLDTYIAVLFAHISATLPISIWMMRSYFAFIPSSIEEAALIDGCSRIGAIFRVVFPLIIPAVVVVSINAFLWSWSDFLFALALTDSQSLRTLPLGIMWAFQAEEMTRRVGIGSSLAMTVLYAIPAIIVFAIIQRYMLKTTTFGAVHGA
jgi:ABC-type glycerol-3-phosphate transport system permease component